MPPLPCAGLAPLPPFPEVARMARAAPVPSGGSEDRRHERHGPLEFDIAWLLTRTPTAPGAAGTAAKLERIIAGGGRDDSDGLAPQCD